MRPLTLLTAIVCAGWITGCGAPPQTARLQAVHAPEPVEVDGTLDERVWKEAPAYPLHTGEDRRRHGRLVTDPGHIRLAWDETHLYVAFELRDRDVRAKGTKDHQHHYKKGDVAELFLKYDGERRYRELYVTPKGHLSCFWFKRKGGKLRIDRDCGLRVAARVDGTLNEANDTDAGWTAEMAVPVAELTSAGAPFGPQPQPATAGHAATVMPRHWRILAGRYNYRADRDGPELSMVPPLEKTSFHRLGGYGRIVFKPAANNP